MPLHCNVDRFRSNYECKFRQKNIVDLQKIGEFNGFGVYKNQEQMIYVLDDANPSKRGWISRVITLELAESPCLKNWYVGMMYLSRKFRRRGLSHKFYYWIINTLKKNIVSGEEQSPGGQSIWWNLAKYPDIDISVVHSKKIGVIRIRESKYKVTAITVPHKKRIIKTLQCNDNTAFAFDSINVRFFARQTKKSLDKNTGVA